MPKMHPNPPIIFCFVLSRFVATFYSIFNNLFILGQNMMKTIKHSSKAFQ